MIALDTNVLVRFIVNDDAEQSGLARAALANLSVREPGFICREVTVEFVSVLERHYKFSRAQIAEVLQDLLASENIVVESDDDVAVAARGYRSGGAGFADRMILLAARRSGSTAVATFDRKLARLNGATLLQSL